MYCVWCGQELKVHGDMPDTGTSVDLTQFYCPGCGRHYGGAIELQDGHAEIEESPRDEVGDDHNQGEEEP